MEENNKVFVGNLPYSVDDAGLNEMFAAVEGVEIQEAVVIKDKFKDNRSRGFGFVTFATAEQAEKAISELNEKEIDGRKMTVSIARPSKRDER